MELVETVENAPMDILPAIDIREGNVVRLACGDYDQQTTYGDNPLAMVEKFIAAGAKWIHVVDLDAARSGKLTNTAILADICKRSAESGAKVQNGGGIRDTQRIEQLQALGVARLVIGSAAIKNQVWFESVLTDDTIANSRLALGLDARDGHVAAEGWTQQLHTTVMEMARLVSGSGLGAIVYTDIARDGMLTGVNLDATAELIAVTDVPVVASGGVCSLEDIRQCKAIGCNGVILGKSLYEGRVDLHEAIEIGQ